mmetsp:Transcript_856/g.2643  ORF Transcript_856/g.2643 Transcript_856/m.2643 type:complete len:330 (+) Transcript_856:2177-3166(+)
MRDKLDDGVRVERGRAGEDAVDGHHVDRVDHCGRVDHLHLGVLGRVPDAGRLDQDGRPRARRQPAAAGRTGRAEAVGGGERARQRPGGDQPVGLSGLGGGEEDGRVRLGAGADHVQPLELGQALEHLRPRRAQVVAVSQRERDERLERLDVALAHCLVRVQVGVLCEHRDEGLALGVHPKLGGDVDGVREAAHHQVDQLVRHVVGRLLHDRRPRGQQRAPRGLEHGPCMLDVPARVVDRLDTSFGLEELLRLLDHQGRLHVEELGLGGAHARGVGRACALHRIKLLDLDLVGGDGLVERLQEGGRQVARVINAAVHVDKLLLRHLLLDL